MPQYACQAFATVEQLVDDGCNCGLAASDTLMEAVLDNASDILHLLSGQRITGVCEVTVRPFGDSHCTPRGFWNSIHGIGGSDYYGVNVIPLRGPNTEIVEVVIDGVALVASEYGLLDQRFLFRKNGGSWPSTQDLTLDATEDGTFEVTYRFNPPADYITQQATLELACELAQDSPSGRLPAGVTSANIQGAAVALRDSDQEERDGLPRVNRFINIYAPGGRNRSGVWSPEMSMGWDLVQVEGPSGS